MAKPKLSFGHGFLEDCTSTTGYDEVEVGLTASIAVEDADFFKIIGDCNAAGDEYAYYEKCFCTNALDDSYTNKYFVRYKTLVASSGLGAKAQLGFIDLIDTAHADDGGVYTDESAEAQNTTANDMTLWPVAPASGDAYLFGADEKFKGIVLNIGTQGSGVWTVIWDYYNGAGWSNLTNVVDNTNAFRAAAGEHTVTFDVPADWAKTTVNGKNKYYIRCFMSVFTSIATQPKGTQAWTINDWQMILGSSGPAFSTNFTVVQGDVTAGKKVGVLRLYADDSPDAVDSGSYEVWFNYVLLTTGLFEFPFISGTESIEFDNVFADLPIFGRVGDISQYGGMANPVIVLDGTMDTNTSWGSPKGERLIQAIFEQCNDPWQYFESDLGNFKVTLRRLRIAKNAEDEAQRTWRLELQKYSRHHGQFEWVWAWLGLK